jgi:hypothetical protein
MQFFTNLINKRTTSSSIRFCLIFSFLFVTVTPFLVWGAVCLMNSKIEDLPAGIITFSLGVLGIITTGKIFEKKEESKNGNA